MDDKQHDESAAPIATALPTGLDEFRLRQERLRDAVDEIQKKLVEQKKPWYRQTATLMSVAGTLFAVLSGLYSIHSARTQDVTKNAEDLQTLVSEMIQVQEEEIQDSSSAKSDFVNYSMRSQLRNTKREALLERAVFKVKAASYQVSPSMFIFLATEADMDGDYKESYDYLQLAAQRSHPGSPEAVAAYFTLAQLCLTDGKSLCKPGDGKFFYLKALDQQPADSDSTHYQRGQLLTRIAVLVRQANVDSSQSEDYLKQAESEETKIAAPTARQQLEQYIATARAAVTASLPTQSPTFSKPEALLGVWHITRSDSPSLRGTATFVQMPTFPFYGAYIDFFQDGKLLEKQSGQVSVLDPKTLRFDWVNLSSRGQSAGYTQFSLALLGKKMSAKQYQLGEATNEYELER